MEFIVENISPVKRRITVTIAPQEMAAAVKAIVYQIKPEAKVKGYRQGKVPDAIVERVHADRIYPQALTDLVGVHLTEIAGNEEMYQVSGFVLTDPTTGKGAKPEDMPRWKKGSPYVYALEYECHPDIDIPPYEGLEVEMERTVVDDDTVEAYLNRLRYNAVKLVAAEGDVPPRDGQAMVFDLKVVSKRDPSIVRENKKTLMQLGQGDCFREFEDALRGIGRGQVGTFELKLPEEDFLGEEIAGHEVTCTACVHGVYDIVVPELDDAFARTQGQPDLDAMRALVRRRIEGQITELNRDEAKYKLMEKLLAGVRVELPAAMVRRSAKSLTLQEAVRLQRSGEEVTEAQYEEILRQCHPHAVQRVLQTVFLVAVARKEGLTVRKEEIAQYVYNVARRDGQDFEELYKKFDEQGMLFDVRDSLLGDKGGDRLLELANVTLVDPKETLRPPEEVVAGEVDVSRLSVLTSEGAPGEGGGPGSGAAADGAAAASEGEAPPSGDGSGTAASGGEAHWS
ncbi:MAG: trigger factor [Desulfovibrio sp.]|nr:trigger factor [Desulfovibrio sp.]